MRINSFDESLRKKLEQIQPGFNEASWERFQPLLHASAAPKTSFWQTSRARVFLFVLALMVLALGIHLAYDRQIRQLQQTIEDLTQERDSLLTEQIVRTRPLEPIPPTIEAPSVLPPVGTDGIPDRSDENDEAPERRGRPTSPGQLRSRPAAEPEPTPRTEEALFDEWFRSVTADSAALRARQPMAARPLRRPYSQAQQARFEQIRRERDRNSRRLPRLQLLRPQPVVLDSIPAQLPEPTAETIRRLVPDSLLQAPAPPVRRNRSFFGQTSSRPDPVLDSSASSQRYPALVDAQPVPIQTSFTGTAPTSPDGAAGPPPGRGASFPCLGTASLVFL
jgi:hypothetical protein